MQPQSRRESQQYAAVAGQATLAEGLSSLPTAFRGLPITQIAFLVPVLASGVETWSAALGKSDWLVYIYSPATVPHLTFRGEPGKFSLRLALSGSSPQLELIEPLEGPLIYHEWLEERGFGVHYLGFHVPRLGPVAQALAADGFSPVQAGSGYGVDGDGDGAFAYYDLVDALGLYTEIIETPAHRLRARGCSRTGTPFRGWTPGEAFSGRVHPRRDGGRTRDGGSKTAWERSMSLANA
jgi:methylmalonyl-CoA/ethylmalonyl-CoA epimerase